ncbi:MAG: hypothetical protein IJ446_01485 [Oscillospiraceae bacterium]|nr:hypothetical protein [Oscillospiraceae bacterium]
MKKIIRFFFILLFVSVGLLLIKSSLTLRIDNERIFKYQDYAVVNWNENNINALNKMPKLKRLIIIIDETNFEINNISRLKYLNKLNSIAIIGGSIDNLSYFFSISELKQLEIYSNSSCLDITGISKFKNLETVVIDSDIKNSVLSEINGLNNLVNLSLYNGSFNEINLNTSNLHEVKIGHNKYLEEVYISKNCSKLKLIEISDSPKAFLTFENEDIQKNAEIHLL